MTCRSPIALLLLLLPTGLCCADMKLDQRTVVVFATVQQGKEILGRQDDFVKRMSPFDRAARIKTDKTVSEKEFLAFVTRNVLSWTPDEIAKVEAALRALKPKLAELSLKFPEEVYVVKTTGTEEGGAAYTRGNALVLPKSELRATKAQLQRLLAHELFHILSRNNPALRERLYAAIGFKPCNEIELPAELKPRKITNPDAPKNDHLIRVSLDGKTVPVVPILFSSRADYDARTGREFFAYLRFQLLVVERDAGAEKMRPVYSGRNPRLVGVEDVSGFFEQVGRNTGYIIHPEEILADNFAILVTGRGNVPSPDILKKMLQVLSGEEQPAKPSAPPDAQKPPR